MTRASDSISRDRPTLRAFLRPAVPALLLVLATSGWAGAAGCGGAPAEDVLEPDRARLMFGEVQLGDEAEASLRVHNFGTGPGAFEAEVEGDAFVLGRQEDPVEQFSAEVPVGGAATVTVTVRGDRTGPVAGTLLLTFESTGRVLEVPVEATVVSPALVFQPYEVDLGPVRLGETASRPLAVVNAGAGWVSAAIVHPAGEGLGPFRVEPADAVFDLAPGEQGRLTVSFSPETPGDAEARLRFRCTPACAEPPGVDLQGQGVGL